MPKWKEKKKRSQPFQATPKPELLPRDLVKGWLKQAAPETSATNRATQRVTTGYKARRVGVIGKHYLNGVLPARNSAHSSPIRQVEINPRFLSLSPSLSSCHAFVLGGNTGSPFQTIPLPLIPRSFTSTAPSLRMLFFLVFLIRQSLLLSLEIASIQSLFL